MPPAQMTCRRLWAVLLLIVGMLGPATHPSPAAADQPLLFLSTQFAPVDEAHRLRTRVLAGFDRPVDFQPYDSLAVLARLAESGAVVPALFGGVHGDMVALHRARLLHPIDPSVVAAAEIPDRLSSLGRLDGGQTGGKQLWYMPWAKATYLMVAHRRALAKLPPGATLDRLSYDELIAWGERLKADTGAPRIGFPAGSNGLIHRFLQGFLYPSYTGTMVRGFRSRAAHRMWQEARRLWQVVNPRSTSMNTMYEALRTGEVWVAWDHVARLLPALRQQPESLVAFPAPAGPTGRGFMLVLAGLAIPAQTPDPVGSRDLIGYLTRPAVQRTVLTEIGFFPVVTLEPDGALGSALSMLRAAVDRQESAEDAIPAILPPGLGAGGEGFNLSYRLAFSRIVLRGRPIAPTLDRFAGRLQSILDAAGAPCWPPDRPSGADSCPIE